MSDDGTDVFSQGERRVARVVCPCLPCGGWRAGLSCAPCGNWHSAVPGTRPLVHEHVAREPTRAQCGRARRRRQARALLERRLGEVLLWACRSRRRQKFDGDERECEIVRLVRYMQGRDVHATHKIPERRRRSPRPGPAGVPGARWRRLCAGWDAMQGQLPTVHRYCGSWVNQPLICGELRIHTWFSTAAVGRVSLQDPICRSLMRNRPKDQGPEDPREGKRRKKDHHSEAEKV